MTIDKLRITPVACTVAEFCHSLSIGKTRFYAEVKAGRIKVLKSGRKTLVPIGEREAYLKRLADATQATGKTGKSPHDTL